MIDQNPRILPFRWLEAILCTKPSKDGPPGKRIRDRKPTGSHVFK
jgi:hypothetical protein